MAGDWLAARRTEVAADRILDAAGELFAHHEAATVGMHEIAKAAGCSRATLYRYFENRDALYTAYVHRESYRLFREMDASRSTRLADPRERLIEGMVGSLRSVRESPALSSWFAIDSAADRRRDGRTLGGHQGADRGVRDLAGPRRPEVVDHRARWLVRVIMSLLVFPGHDEADERAMLDEFVLPLVAPRLVIP